MRQPSQMQRLTVAGISAASAVAAFLLTAPAEGFSVPSSQAGAHGFPVVADVGATPQAASTPLFADASSASSGSSLQSAGRFLLVAGVAVVAAKCTTLIQRRAVPKHRSALHTTRRRRIRWCQKGERRAMQALSLAKQIKKGTANFIYGRPQDEEDYEDDDYEDDEFEDEDDDELEKKALA
eukprot:TRINITY_DN6073_c0_g1_i2.p1 TRINITY_DN6073_c0_g1~~TRINITY_DN6073_c0_g1_i2.p1  ORF type:complete len:181 (+),score=52.04 TRINITY_DN6073_c0_g1_i2:68-610(+)